MRDFKFRAWAQEVKMMIPWKYLNLELEDGYGGVKDNSIYDVLKDVENQCTSDFELMQYTGKKDKNGKDIYEGDILSVEVQKEIDSFFNFTEPVVWNDQFSSFDFEGSEIHGIGFGAISDKYTQAEVKGNIYENPELLK